MPKKKRINAHLNDRKRQHFLTAKHGSIKRAAQSSAYVTMEGNNGGKEREPNAKEGMVQEI